MVASVGREKVERELFPGPESMLLSGTMTMPLCVFEV